MKPQVKESEKNRVLSTTDYNLFVVPDFRISRKFLSEIEESIGEKNLCKDYPVIVEDKTYRIIDGRYRFLASKGKRLPIYYKIAEVTSIYDAVRIKNLVKRSDYELVINTFADLLEPYNDIKVLSDLFREIPLQYVVRATKVACRKWKEDPRLRRSPAHHYERIDHRKLQTGKLEVFDFEATKLRLQTISLFHDYFKDKIRPKVFKGEYRDRIQRLTWSDSFLICAHYNWDREVIESEKSFIVECQKAGHGFDPSFFHIFELCCYGYRSEVITRRINKHLSKIEWGYN